MIATDLKIGDPVYIDSCEGFGGPAHIIAVREADYARYRVAMVDGNPPPFWAHDFEVQVEANHGRLTESEVATHIHIQVVQAILSRVICDLQNRSLVHDASKVQSPEKEGFEEFTKKLAGSTYGSEEYKGFLAAMKPFLDHHYAANDHHPEHFPDGIRGMSLLSLLEMLCDWKAATLRHNDGDIRRSIDINQKRFGYSDELKQIFLNTLGVIEGNS